jgi:hypothetical protein
METAFRRRRMGHCVGRLHSAKRFAIPFRMRDVMGNPVQYASYRVGAGTTRGEKDEARGECAD